MIREAAIGYIQRALDVVERQSPQLTEGYLRSRSRRTRAKSSPPATESSSRSRRSHCSLRASEIAKPHDYHVRMAVGRSILLTRDGEGRAHAFLQLLPPPRGEPAQGCGNARAFLCPYHGWSYDTKGRLTNAAAHRFKRISISAAWDSVGCRARSAAASSGSCCCQAIRSTLRSISAPSTRRSPRSAPSR